MHHHLLHLAQINHSFIRAILHCINSDLVSFVAIIPFEKRFHELKLKIKANFIKRKHSEVWDIFHAYWSEIECVDFFIQQNFKQYEQQLNILNEKILNHFKTVPLNHQGVINFPVNDPAYFEELSYLIIPKGKKTDPRYMLTAKVFVLFLFKHGEFGARIPQDPPSLFHKLEKSI